MQTSYGWGKKGPGRRRSEHEKSIDFVSPSNEPLAGGMRVVHHFLLPHFFEARLDS